MRQVALAGNPDRLGLGTANGTLLAFVSDPAGWVTALDGKTLAMLARKRFPQARDLSIMPDGHAALATGDGGVVVLDENLEQVKRVF
jgi:hypothetical protein